VRKASPAPRPTAIADAGAPSGIVAVAAPFEASPPPPSIVEALPSTAFTAQPPSAAALIESAPSTVGLTRRPARRIHLALVAVAGLSVGIALGLATLPLVLSALAATSSPTSLEQSQHDEPVLPPAAPSTPAVEAKAVATTNGGAAMPWDDVALVKVPSCAELAAPSLSSSSPKGFLLQGALKEAPRALMRGDAPAAHLAFCVATQLGARTPAMLSGLSQTQLMLGDANAALSTADQLVQLNPTVAAHLDLRGDVLIRLGRVEEARSSWFSAARASRASDLLIRNLLRSSKSAADAALRAGDLPRADRMLRRAIALGPKDAAPCLQLAAVLAKSGQQGAAQRWQAYAQSLAR
jgi:Flp pilus assembly protein TadD